MYWHGLQVFALLEHPELMDKAPHLFPADVIARAREYLQHVYSMGAYSHSQGTACDIVSMGCLHSQ